jgi:hypothetical protein
VDGEAVGDSFVPPTTAKATPAVTRMGICMCSALVIEGGNPYATLGDQGERSLLVERRRGFTLV